MNQLAVQVMQMSTAPMDTMYPMRIEWMLSLRHASGTCFLIRGCVVHYRLHLLPWLDDDEHLRAKGLCQVHLQFGGFGLGCVPECLCTSCVLMHSIQSQTCTFTVVHHQILRTWMLQ